MKNQNKKVWMKLGMVCLGAISGATAFAASTGTLTVQGTVALVNDLVVTANGTNNTTLNITGGETAKVIASVSESSNDSLGYKISISSANGGKLQLAGDSTKSTPYLISYDGGSYSAPATTAATVKTISSLSALTTNTSVVRTNVTAYPAAIAGVYSDTLTFSIIAN